MRELQAIYVAEGALASGAQTATPLVHTKKTRTCSSSHGQRRNFRECESSLSPYKRVQFLG